VQWLAVQYDSAAREQALGTLGVQGIPMLSIVAPNGKMVEANAVQVDAIRPRLLSLEQVALALDLLSMLLLRMRCLLPTKMAPDLYLACMNGTCRKIYLAHRWMPGSQGELLKSVHPRLHPLRHMRGWARIAPADRPNGRARRRIDRAVLMPPSSRQLLLDRHGSQAAGLLPSPAPPCMRDRLSPHPQYIRCRSSGCFQ